MHYVGEILSLDIISYSQMTNEEQLSILSELNMMLKNNLDKYSEKFDIKYVPNGDGFHIISNDGWSLFIAIVLRKIETNLKKKFDFFKGYRISVIEGTYYVFKDICSKENYYGEGIVLAESLTSCKDLCLLNNIIIEKPILKKIKYSLLITLSNPFNYDVGKKTLELVNVWIKD